MKKKQTFIRFIMACAMSASLILGCLSSFFPAYAEESAPEEPAAEEVVQETSEEITEETAEEETKTEQDKNEIPEAAKDEEMIYKTEETEITEEELSDNSVPEVVLEETDTEAPEYEITMESALGAEESKETRTEKSLYGIWDPDKKKIFFSTAEPEGGEYTEITSLKSFIRSHTDAESIDFYLDSGEKIPADSVSGLFSGFASLREIECLGNLDTSECTDFSSMFQNCTSLKSLNLKGLDTSKAVNMERMFYNCSAMEFLDLTGINTSRVTSMRAMFYQMRSIKNLDVSVLDTSKVTNMYMMIAYCSSLTEIDLSSFNTTSVSSGGSYINGMAGLLFGCSSLKSADLSGITDGTYHRVLENFLTGCTDLSRIVLGPKQKLKLTPNAGGTATYGVWGLDGPWAYEEDTSIVYSADALYINYDPQTMSGVWIRIPDSEDGHFYRTDGSLDADNLWEVHSPDSPFKGYCLNLGRTGVGTYLDRVTANSDEDIIALLCSEEQGSTHGYSPLGNSMREALVTLIYYGWPNDAGGIQAKYGLTHDQYMDITQNAIWDFTDRYADPAGESLYTGNELAAYRELVSQSYAGIGTDYSLYLYSSWNPDRQNLISLMSISDRIYGGVEVTKLGPNGEPLQGAEFTVYDSEGNAVGTMVTRAGGTASLCRTDYFMGLPGGTYTIKETGAPAGYLTTDDVFTFEIRENNVIVVVGKKNGGSEDEPIIFTDDEDEDYTGGGVMVQKTGDSGETLENAVFTIYDADGKEVTEIRTNASGVARTGIRDLPLGTYTIRETKAPGGYFLSDEVKTFTLTQDGKYYSAVLTFTDTAKAGSIQLSARKKVEGGTLKEGEYTFELQNADGVMIQRKTNDADGNIVFDEFTYGPSDLGFINYRIVEVIGDEEYTNYDRHAEKITVTITDTGEDTLQCTAIYDSDGAVFVNQVNAEKFKIRLRKMITNKNIPLKNVTLCIRDISGRTVAEWITDGTEYEIELFPGVYKFFEIFAQSGYEYAEPITFTVREDGTITSNTAGSVDEDLITMNDKIADAASFTVWKTDEADGTPLEGAVFELSGKDEDGDEILISSTSDENGLVTFSGLISGVYTLRETSAPYGYEKSDEEWTVTVDRKAAYAHSSNIRDDGTVTGNYPNYARETVPVTLDGAEWVHVRIVYQIEEGYDYLYLKNSAGETQTEDRNGKTIGEFYGGITGGYDKKEILSDSYDLDGDTVVFYFTSDGGVSAYGYFAAVSSVNVSVSGPDGEITSDENGIYEYSNERTLIDISVTKEWEDEENRDGVRPDSVTVRLKADGEEIRKADLTEEGGWKWTFTDLPVSNNGKQITYTVTEDAVDDYSPEIKETNDEDGNLSSVRIINTHTSDVTCVSVAKVWDDGDDADGIRPDSVTVVLKAGGKTADVEDAEVVLNEENKWTYTWKNLPYKADGKDIVYTVEETSVPDGYTMEITGDQNKGYTIINHHQKSSKKKKSRKSVDTGDKNDMKSYLVPLLLSLLMLTGTLIRIRKERIHHS